MAENTTNASPLEEAIKQQNGTPQYDFSENNSTNSTQERETQDRRFFSQGERKSMPAADKAGPHNSFPVKSQQDVYNAARLAGHAKNPDAVRAKIRAIAKRKGFSLPKSWQKKTASRSAEEETSTDFTDVIEIDFPDEFQLPTYDIDADETVDPQGFTSETEEERAVTPVQNPPDAAPEPGTHHDAYAGMHSHRHEHVADGYSHEHHHQHVNDNDHFHGHAHGHSRAHTPEERELYKQTEQPLSNHDEEKKLQETEKRSNEPINSIQQTASMYMPFIRVDATKREVLGQATSEVPDSYGTIFAYYPKAWEQWRGNIREQHDPKKAVGKRIQHFLNPESRSVDLHVRVSRGAQDTWMKIEDDVLTGFSLSVIPDTEFGNDYRKWPKKTFEGREYPYLPRYSIAEVSLVDNPSCPNCNIQIVRSDGFATDVLDVTDEEEKPIERAVVRGMDAETVSKMHKGIKATLHSAMTQMENCNCPTCQKVARMLDPDMDGDIDLGGLDDPDHDAKQLGVETERAITGIVERSLQPVYARLQRIAGSLAKSTPESYDSIVTSVIARAFETFDQKLEAIAKESSFEEVRAELSAVKSQVDKIADQPMPGGPVMNASNIPMPATASLAQPVEKRLPTDAPISYGQQGYGSVYDAVATLSRAGKLNTTDKQVDAVAAALAEQRRR